MNNIVYYKMMADIEKLCLPVNNYLPPLGAGGLQGRPHGLELGRQSAAIISPLTINTGFEYFIHLMFEYCLTIVAL